MFLNRKPSRRSSSKSTTSIPRPKIGKPQLVNAGSEPEYGTEGLAPQAQDPEPQTQTFEPPSPNPSEKSLPSPPTITSQVFTSFTQSEDSGFNQSRDMDDGHLPGPRYTAYGGQSHRASSVYPGDTTQDFDDSGRKAGRGYPDVGRAMLKEVIAGPYHSQENHFEVPVIPPPFKQAAPSSEKLRKPPNQDGPYHIKEKYDDVPFTRPALEQAAPPSRKLTKSPNQDGPKRKPKWYWAISILAAFIVIIVATLAGLGSGGYFSVDKQDKATTESETFSASSTPLLTESPVSERVTNAAIPSENVPTSVVVLTSSIETSETPSSTPTPTPTSPLESSSVQSSSSLSSPSIQSSSFMQSTAVLENLVGRSGYLDQRADGSLRYDSLLDLDQGGYLDRREDLEDCEDVTITITTTLTTTITSTIRTSGMVASSAGSDSASLQPSEPEPAETGPKCITNTIYHTDGLPISTDTWDDTDIPSMEVSSVAADSTASPDTTPLPTETSATLSAGEETGVISTSSVAQAGRRAAPYPLDSLRYLRRFLPLFLEDNEQNRHLLPSLIIPTATTKNNDVDKSYSVKVLSTTSSNAAVRREVQHWKFMGKPNPAVPSRIHERRVVPAQPPSLLGTEVMKTYWDAYWDFRLLIIQMCFSVKSEKPPTSGDVKMGQTLNETICDNFEQDFPAISEGAKCDHKDSFERLNSIVKALCALAKEGEKYVQSLALLCHVQDTLKGKVYECGGEEGGVVSGTGTMIAASLMETFDSGPSTTKEEPAPSTGVEATPDSGQIASDVPSFSLQQNAVENADPPPVGPSVSPVALASEPPLVTSAASLLPSPVPPTPPIPGNSPVSASPPSASGVGVPLQHPPNTPPADWTIPMLTYTTQPITDASTYTSASLRTVPTDVVAKAPDYTGEHLSRDWPEYFPFPIPTGYVTPNIVPADPQIGHLTHFGPGIGACGGAAMESNELAVAISWVLYDMGEDIGGSPLEENWTFLGTHADGKDQMMGALCFRGIRAWMADDQGNKLVEQEFTVRDRCTACNVTHLDIQDDVFRKYWDGGGDDRISVTWKWMQHAPTDVAG